MKVLLIFAHPDDETFSSSGTIIHLTKRGHDVRLIMATRGEAGMLGDPPIATRKTLPKIREGELKNAARITGLKKIYFLELVDGTLTKINPLKMNGKIAPILNKEKPDVVITFEKNGISMHPDHKVISKIATKCFMDYMKTSKKRVRMYHVCLPASHVKIHHDAGFKYEHFGKMVGTPDDEITTKVDISDIYSLKVKAMKCHKTQRKDYETLLKRNEIIPGKKYEYFKLIAENALS